MRLVALICCGSDMANVQLGWVVEGVIQPDESVEGMLRVIKEKGEGDHGTFWCWNGRVSLILKSLFGWARTFLTITRVIHGDSLRGGAGCGSSFTERALGSSFRKLQGVAGCRQFRNYAMQLQYLSAPK